MSKTTGFTSDNIAGASPEVLAAVTACSAGQAAPYGADPWSERVKVRLCEAFEREVEFFLVPTGSAANALALSGLTPPWGSVLCHPDSHIQNDECGAPEFYTGGAKLVPVGGPNGKIDPAALHAQLRRKVGDVHSVQPTCVSITDATEVGSVYSVGEVGEIGALCREAGVRLHMDGARFANALISLGCTAAELTWKAGVDILSLGATKNGAMCADVVVLFDPARAAELAYRRKRGGLLSSKMRFLAAQIDAYLDGGLWLNNARQANHMAQRLERGLRAVGIEPLCSAEANILFCRFPTAVTSGLLADGFQFYHDRWEPGVVRLVTSFATTEEDVDRLITAVRQRSAYCDGVTR